MPGNSTRYTLPDWIENLSFEHALKLLLLYFTGGTVPPASGGGGTPTSVNGVQVSGIQEVDSSTSFTSPTGKTINPGGLSWAVYPLSGFVGSIKYGTGSAITWTEAMGPASRDAQPGNTLPGATITCSAGSYIVVEGRPS